MLTLMSRKVSRESVILSIRSQMSLLGLSLVHTERLHKPEIECHIFRQKSFVLLKAYNFDPTTL
jgi:hypothetical protein